MDDEEMPWFLEHVAHVDDVRPVQERLPERERVDEVRWSGIVFELTEGPPFQS